MSLKIKLISTISAFILVVSLMLVGILAAGSATLNIGGNVSFTANSVYAQIAGSIEGTAEHPTGSPLSLSTIDIDYTDTETAIDLNGDNSDWTTMPLNFDEDASAITVKMNIENKATDRAIKITLTDNTSIGNVKVVRKYNDTTFEESTNTQTINGGEVARYEFTLSLQSQNNDVSGAFNLDIALENFNQSSTTEGYSVTINNNSGDQSFVVKTNLEDSNVYTIESLTSEEITVSSILYLTLKDIYFTEASSNKSEYETINPFLDFWPSEYNVVVNSTIIGSFVRENNPPNDSQLSLTSSYQNDELNTYITNTYILTCEITRDVVINIEMVP